MVRGIGRGSLIYWFGRNWAQDCNAFGTDVWDGRSYEGIPKGYVKWYGTDLGAGQVQVLWVRVGRIGVFMCQCVMYEYLGYWECV